MAWRMEEYSRLREYDSPGIITGKPLVIGGSEEREKEIKSNWSYDKL
jgi:glutamate dehydrogenase